MDHSPPPKRPRRRWRGRFHAAAASAAVHAALVAALLVGWRTTAPPLLEPPIPINIAPLMLARPPQPPAPLALTPKRARALAHKPAPKLAAAHVPRRRRDQPPPLAARLSPAPPADASPPAAVVPARGSGDGDGLTQSQLAGAQAAGDGAGSGDAGAGGGACDMARRVQAAVRKDPLARAAIHTAGARAIMIWNGDWVQHGAEDGKGLAAVREAITFEVAFAPPACRHQRVRGLVLISLADGSARLALGAGEWRWSDLLGLR